jgi:hypothetical protein
MDQNYSAMRADKISIYATANKDGLIICKTHHHFIIGTYNSTMYAGVAVEAIEKLGIKY